MSEPKIYDGRLFKLFQGDSLETLKIFSPESVDLIFFSPPYWDIHKYTDDPREIGHGQTCPAYMNYMEQLLMECKTILKPTGNIVVNVMDLVRGNMPIELSNFFVTSARATGLIYVERIAWYIRNKMPVASNRRFVNKMEWILHFAKTDEYFFDKNPVREAHSHYAAKDKRKWKWNSNGKCPGNVWDIPSYRVSGQNKVHVAGFPQALCDRVIKCWSKEGDVVLDPFSGSGTSGVSALELNREYRGIELSETYFDAAQKRLALTESKKGVN